MKHDSPSKLTPAQIAILQVARDQGHAFAQTGCKQRAGGARQRMVNRLRDQGLLTWAAPYKLTNEGRKALLGVAENNGVVEDNE